MDKSKTDAPPKASLNTSPLPVLFTLEVHNALGENVLWDDEKQRILWTDIQASQLYEYHISTQEMRVRQLPERLTSFGFTDQTDLLICSFESGFAYYHLSTKQITWLKKMEADNPGTRLNDGRVDRHGHFWAGTMVENADIASDQGYLYRLQAGASAEQATTTRYLSNLLISNGLCWSPSGDLMYHADSPRHTITRYTMNTSKNKTPKKNTPATLTQPVVFATTADDHFPDGAITDKHGNLWSAQWDSSSVVCYSPEGSIIRTVNLPVSQVSCVAIGGPTLDWLIVTSASELSAEQRQSQPQAGNVFVFQLPESIGLPESRYKTSA